MESERTRGAALRAAIAISLMMLLAMGCITGRHAIVTATGTNIGVDVSQNPTTNSPQAKLGYQRTEVAIVPTNRSAKEDPGSQGNGAADLGDVLMELRYGGIFDLGASSGIYQRLAVGKTAVSRPGAAMMFARDADGNVSADAKAALQSLESVPEMSVGVRSSLAKLGGLRKCHKQEVDAAIESAGAGSYDAISDGDITTGQLNEIMAAVENLEECPPEAAASVPEEGGHNAD